MGNNHANSPKSLGNRQPKCNNFDPQLQFPWVNQVLQESQLKIPAKPSQSRIQREPFQLEKADKRLQKITEQQSKSTEPETQPEFPFMQSMPMAPAPPVSNPPMVLMADENADIKELSESFPGKGEVKGFKFDQIQRSTCAYIYQVQASGRSYYEIFQRRVNTQFGIVSYPGSEAFGRWAWTTCDFCKAMEIFNALNNKRNEPCA